MAFCYIASTKALYCCFSEVKHMNILHQSPLFVGISLAYLTSYWNGWKFCCPVLLFNTPQFPNVSYRTVLIQPPVLVIFGNVFLPVSFSNCVHCWHYKGTSVKWWVARVRCGLCCSHIMEKECIKIGTWNKKPHTPCSCIGKIIGGGSILNTSTLTHFDWV